jgi:hypothetical protein
LTCNNGKYKRTIPLGRNNLPIVRSNPGYKVPNSKTTNLWSNQVIEAYNAYIPREVSNKHYHTLIPSTINHNIDDQPKLGECDLTEVLLIWHQRLAYMSFKLLQHVSKVGYLPRRLSRIQHPKFHACMIDKAAKVPWRVKWHTSHVTNTTKPGERVSVDQLESPTPGLIARLKGIPTTKR